MNRPHVFILVAANLSAASRTICSRSPAATSAAVVIRPPLDTMHQGTIGACGQCHSQRAWTPATFDNESLFSLTSDHEAPCKTCHVGKDYRTSTCYGCHERTRSNPMTANAATVSGAGSRVPRFALEVAILCNRVTSSGVTS